MSKTATPGNYITFRATPEAKTALRAIAVEEGITQSTLLRLGLAIILRTCGEDPLCALRDYEREDATSYLQYLREKYATQ